MLNECHLRPLAKESISIKNTLIHHPHFYHPPSCIIYPPSSIIYPSSSIILTWLPGILQESEWGCSRRRNWNSKFWIQEIQVMAFKNYLGLMEKYSFLSTMPRFSIFNNYSSILVQVAKIFNIHYLFWYVCPRGQDFEYLIFILIFLSTWPKQVLASPSPTRNQDTGKYILYILYSQYIEDFTPWKLLNK